MTDPIRFGLLGTGQWARRAFIGNLLAMPGATLVNVNLHYDPSRGAGRLSFYASVQNLFDVTSVGSASVIS